ncbi:MAG: hypothetical protein HUK40_07040 [Desulfobacter sp.]|nr:hypothetical protein [Desulfobacter sp.]WDP85016.1 MAG: hypothetical protein HUN05_07580 [Desulfobacter sp.]
MKDRFYCDNPECRDREGKTIVVVMNQESIMDDDNLAQMFCPKCRSRLVRCYEETRTAC